MPETDSNPSSLSSRTSSAALSEASAGAPRRGRGGWAVLLAVVALAAVPLSGVFLWQRVLQPLQAQRTADREVIDDLVQRHAALENWQASASDDLSALEKHSRDLAARLDQLEPGRLSAWALTEAEYLVASAQRAVTFDHDPQRAAVALRLASIRLAPVPNSATARRAIDNARSALRAVSMPDVADLGRQLGVAAEALQQAPLREPGQAPTAQTAGGWRGALNQAWQQLSDVVVVQRVGTPVQPLLRPQETQYLREQLALKLAAADYALQRRDTASVRRELADVRAWADAYLDTASKAGSDAGAKALETLARLANIDLQPALPDLTGLDEPLVNLRRATVEADSADDPT